MLDSEQVREITRQAAFAEGEGLTPERIVAQPSIDSEGKDSLRITIVLKPAAIRNLTGETAIDLLVAIQSRLLAAGEERLPIVEYATEQELEIGDSAEEDT